MVRKVKQKTGSRAQVMHGNAKMTAGGLKKKDLKYNKRGRIVSRKASILAKKNNRLVKAGYKTRKGIFGVVKKGGDKFKIGGAGPPLTQQELQQQQQQQQLQIIQQMIQRLQALQAQQAQQAQPIPLINTIKIAEPPAEPAAAESAVNNINKYKYIKKNIKR
jgi:hypothetical protein